MAEGVPLLFDGLEDKGDAIAITPPDAWLIAAALVLTSGAHTRGT